MLTEDRPHHAQHVIERRLPADEVVGFGSRASSRGTAGASNCEIAQALFVTVRTVEMHFGHA